MESAAGEGILRRIREHNWLLNVGYRTWILEHLLIRRCLLLTVKLLLALLLLLYLGCQGRGRQLVQMGKIFFIRDVAEVVLGVVQACFTSTCVYFGRLLNLLRLLLVLIRTDSDAFPTDGIVTLIKELVLRCSCLGLALVDLLRVRWSQSVIAHP